MTVEEIEILVTAKVEEALKEFVKIVPAIKQSMKQAQEAFSKVNMNGFAKKVQQAMVLVKKKIEMLKNSSKNSEVKITVNNKEAQKQISQVQKQIDSLQKQINARQMKLNVITPQLDKITQSTTKEVTPDGLSSDNPAIQKTINNTLSNNKDYSRLATQEEKLVQETELYNKQLDEAKSKMSQLEQETAKTGASQNKLTSFFSAFKEKLQPAKGMVENIKNIFSKLPNITKIITSHIKTMGTGIKSGLVRVLKYAGALFSLRGIYSTLSNSASAWLSSQNAGAQQLSSNIEYMKYAMGSSFAPIIEYVIGLVYQLMKAIQSLVYAFSGINIFAKATASSMKSTAGSAKQASKSLSRVHSEINNVSENNGDNGSGATSPSMDLSQVDGQMNPLSQKLYDFFKPLVDSWKTYGTELIEQVKTTVSQVGGLISSVWGSFEKVITNGTIYSILENILAIIGNIAEAFSNAWNHNGNGDVIIQNLANAFNNLLGTINNVIKSEGFQNWLNNCSDKFKQITDKISEIDWQPLVNALTTIGTTVGTIALDILSGLVGIFKWLAENPIVAEILLAIAIAIGIVGTTISVISTAMEIWSTVVTTLTTITTALHISLLPLIAIILVIIGVIALVVLAIMNWDSVMNFLKQTVGTVINAIVGFITNLWSQVSFIFGAIWNIVSPIVNAIWQVISTVFQAIWNIISTILGSIWNVFSQIFGWIFELVSKVFQGIWNVISPIINAIWNAIKIAMNGIQQIWSTVWTTVKNVVTNIWNGIWSCIKSVINSILGGIEGMVNGVVRGVNFILRGISSVANAIGSLIGLKPINLQLSTISLPRLAKGGVLTEATALIAGEYSGAKSNPEIVTPQNIMYDTMKKALSDSNANNNEQTIQLSVYVGNTKLGQILLQDLRSMKRQTGKDIEALVGG